MDKITLLNHPVDVLCDNVRQNATKVIVSSSPLKSGSQVSVGHFFNLVSQKISHFLNSGRKRICTIMSGFAIVDNLIIYDCTQSIFVCDICGLYTRNSRFLKNRLSKGFLPYLGRNKSYCSSFH